MFKSFPVASCQIKPPDQIGNIGFHAASPFLQPGLHVFAAYDVFQATHDLVKNDIDEAFFLCVFGIGFGCVSAVGGAVPGHFAV